jgi:hypothetical protein
LSDRTLRVAGENRGLVWTAAACITFSLLVMLAISAAGPSISVPGMAHTTGAPPWWVSLGLPSRFVLFTLWATAVLAAAGVGAGLIAVARGARPRVRPLLAASFIAVAAFTVLPPAGTTDTQSYAIDGNMVVLGHSPYVDTPREMAVQGDVLALHSPVTWENSLSDYGPLATAEEWTSAELGGSSMALITFWLKLWGRPIGLTACLLAGVLLGAATAIKSPFALFALGAVWAMRRSTASVTTIAAGWLAVLVPSYAIAGVPAVQVLFQRGSQVTWDNLYQVFYRPFGIERFGSDQVPAHLATIATVLFIVVAVLALLRMPDAVPGLPAVAPALALSLAWVFFWPYQRPWYDVMVIAPLALYAVSWLDTVVLVRLCFGAITYMESAHIAPYLWIQHVQLVEGEWVTSTVRMLSAAAFVWMCITGRWGTQSTESSVNVTPPALQPQLLDPATDPVDNRVYTGCAELCG